MARAKPNDVVVLESRIKTRQEIQEKAKRACCHRAIAPSVSATRFCSQGRGDLSGNRE
jgi:hypothetical protein